MNNNSEIKYGYSEFGSIERVRFLDPESVTIYDEDGNEMMCQCGNKATRIISGNTACLALCTRCSGWA